MKKDRNSKGTSTSTKYRQVKVSGLNRRRRGKHHDLVVGIIDELRTVPLGAALEIPLGNVGGIRLANLRSAVHRASVSAGIAIETLADRKNFYIWKKRAPIHAE
jgi:hypothetical protein